MPETERQSIARLTRETEAKTEAEAVGTTADAAGDNNNANANASKQAEGNEKSEGNRSPPQFSNSSSSSSSSDESDYSIPADGGGGSHPPNWKISVKKILGARVYAEYLNGDWYWGNIVRLRGSYRGKNLRFRVLFEDGDDVDDLEAHMMITEKEYIDEKREGEEQYPPYPKPKRRELTRLLEAAKGKQTAKENGMASAQPISHPVSTTTAPTISASSPAISVTAAIIRNNCTGTGSGHSTADPTSSPPAKKQKLDFAANGNVNLNANTNANTVPTEINVPSKITSKVGQSAASSVPTSTAAIAKPPPEIRPTGVRADPNVREAVDTVKQSSHFLVGRGYAFEWTDVWGENKIIYGKISRRVDTDQFEVEYSEASRKALLLMSKKSVFGSSPIIPATETIKEDQAWGGCACFERKMLLHRGPESVIRKLSRDKPCKIVIVPEMRHQKLVDYDGKKVPEVTLLVRGFKLVFSVKRSTIPNAGLGVFVRCSSFRRNANESGAGPEIFQLMAGELLVSEKQLAHGCIDAVRCHAVRCSTSRV